MKNRDDSADMNGEAANDSTPLPPRRITALPPASLHFSPSPMSHNHRVSRVGLGLALGLLAAPVSGVSAQDVLERLELHGSLNAGYGRSDSLGVFGIPQKGTSDYRVFTLQGRFALTAKDQVVAQVFNRRLGTSPMAGAIADVTMQWAYWQHKEGDFTVKVGRNPLPRGLMNEVRYIGTVLPFFRPPIELQAEAFDALDGAVISYRHELPLGIGFEQHAFGGGSENRAIASTAKGQEIRIARTENMFGGQTYLTLPVANVRLGLYGARYGFIQPTGRGYRSNVIASAEGSASIFKLQTEHGRFTGYGPVNDNRNGYVWLTTRLHDRFAVAGQYAYTRRKLYATNPKANRMYMDTRTEGVAGMFNLTGNAVLKLEHHWRDGYAFDNAVPVVKSQTPTSVVMAPPQKARYILASVAASF